MGAGALWSLSGLRPGNLLVVILDDGRYAITGGLHVSLLTRPARWRFADRVAGSASLDPPPRAVCHRVADGRVPLSDLC